MTVYSFDVSLFTYASGVPVSVRVDIVVEPVPGLGGRSCYSRTTVAGMEEMMLVDDSSLTLLRFPSSFIILNRGLLTIAQFQLVLISQ